MVIDLFTVYSYGGGDALFYAFNAISMLFQSSLITSLINLSLALGLLWAGIKSAIERDHHRPYVRWFMTYLFITIALVPHNQGMTLHIRDLISGKANKVDYLPPGLVLPAAFISNIGYTLTKNFETVFSMPDKNYLSYHEYGTMFGAEVMSELQNFRVQDPILRENLESYINNCIMYDVMIGHSYDIADLKNAPDILSMIKTHASAIRMFNYRFPKTQDNKDKLNKGRALKTCKEGIEEIATSLNTEHNSLSLKFPFLSAERTLSTSSANSATTSSTPQTNSGLLNALSATLGFYGNTQSAESQLKQIFLINAFKLQPNSYGTVRAAQSQNTAWKLSGEMAKQTLPIIHALFQALIYSTFPIIICLMFFPGGFRALLSYFGMMIWIELWPILFAILNLIVSAFASRYSFDITIQSIDSIVASQSNYALAAASLGMLVPVLSYMIVKGGAGQFVHIAGSLTGATMQGVGLSTQEIISGNRSFDNLSVRNKSTDIVNANKFDTSTYIDTTGHIKEKLPGGGVQTDLNDKRIYQTGKGYTGSAGDTSIEVSGSTKDSVQEAYQEHRARSQTLATEYAKTTQSLERKGVDFLSTMAENIAKGKNYSIDTTTESGKNLTNTLSKVHELHEKYDYSWQQASAMALNTELGLKGGLLGVNLGGVSVSTEDSNTQLANQGTGESSSVNDDQRIAEHQAEIKRWTESVNYGSTDTEEKRLANSISKTFETAKSQRESLSESLSKVSQLQDSIVSSDERVFHSSTSLNDEVRNYIANRPDPNIPSVKIGQKKALDIMEAGGNALEQYLNDYKNSFYAKTKHNLEEKRAQLHGDTNFDFDKKRNEYKPQDETENFKTQQQAKHFKDFSIDGTDIKNNVHSEQNKVIDAIDKQKADIKSEKSRLRGEANQADDEKSLVAKAFSKENPNVEKHDTSLADVVTLGASVLLRRTPLKMSAGRQMSNINKVLPGVTKQVLKSPKRGLPNPASITKLPKPKNE